MSVLTKGSSRHDVKRGGYGGLGIANMLMSLCRYCVEGGEQNTEQEP